VGGKGAVRIDRLLANLGYGSRKDVQRLVAGGRVAVDGRVATNAAATVDPATVTLDGEPLDAPHGLVVALHKPAGYVCSHSDREGPRVFDLLPEQWLRRNPRPNTVGRLDKDSRGLVLVTDRGALVHALTAPRRHVEKRYVVTLDRDPGADLGRLVEQFASGTLMLRGDDTACRPAHLERLDGSSFAVVLTEGRHRQVRRMFGSLGYEVTSLLRTHMGPYALGDLAEGEWRHVEGLAGSELTDG
jgi:16S rRNA pseudouridine516 synthase